MELLRNSKDKKARKLTKKRVSQSRAIVSRRALLTEMTLLLMLQLGTLLRSKRKLEELQAVIQEQRRQAGH
jgi:large subunit ribosomal protein L36e